MTPTLIILFKIPGNIAVGTDLVFASLTKIVGVAAHGARGNVNWRIVTRLAAGSMPASIATIFVMAQLKAHGKPLDNIILPVLGISLVAAAPGRYSVGTGSIRLPEVMMGRILAGVLLVMGIGCIVGG